MTTKSGGDGDENERRWKAKLEEERKEARKRRYYAPRQVFPKPLKVTRQVCYEGWKYSNCKTPVYGKTRLMEFHHCRACGFDYLEVDWKKHEYKHTKLWCPNSFFSGHSLMIHGRKEHGKPLPPKVSKDFLCQICRVKLSSSNSLIRHEDSHSENSDSTAMGVRVCIVPECNAREKGGSGFKVFPKDKTLRKEWKRAIEAKTKQKIKLNKDPRICLKHFVKTDFESGLAMSGGPEYKANRLKRIAVPELPRTEDELR
ncbi:hypothetical protein DMENIID0001_170070 [Sergentomyia squamirostris]